MKKLSLFLALMLLFSSIGLTAFAQEAQLSPRFNSYDEVNEAITVIPATDSQAELGYLKGITAILEVDGLQFKDLNGNGKLDVYEDWRQDTEARAADLIAQLTLEEKSRFLIQTDMPKSTYADENGTENAWYYITGYGITHMLDNNGEGTPDLMAMRHNTVQAAAETTAYGIPVTVTSDRQYNAWAGYIDTAHDAIGTANDIELASAVLSAYAKETAATGIHVTLQPYGVEIGSWYGEDPAYLAEMTAAEVQAYQSNGVYTCVKHFITRGGDQSFASGRSIAANVENYMYPWKAAIDADTQWIMTNSAGEGLDGLNVDFSSETMKYLRETLGFDGVVVTDWGSIGYAAKGIDANGIDLGALSNPERYAYEINNGVDQLGINNATLDKEHASGSCYNLNDVYAAVKDGLISVERVDQAVARLLRTKFNLQLFENPYHNPQEALKLAASTEYLNAPWTISDSESLAAARNPELVEMERKLEAASAVLVKNDNHLLPLNKDQKVYVNSTNGSAIADYKQCISSYASIVDSMEEADIIIADLTRIDDSAELLVEDAVDAGKPLLIVANCIDPDAWMLEAADALLFLNFTRIPDHGSARDGLIFTTEPVVYAQLLYGERKPTGKIVKEIARDTDMDLAQWKDLAGDQGASMDVRMLLEAIMLSDEQHATPNNYGDPLLQYQYGMSYDQDASFRYSTLVVPTEKAEISVNLFLDFYETQIVTVNAPQKSGEAFPIYCIVWNDGADGVTDVEIRDNGTTIATRTMAVTGNSWRIMKLNIALEGAGEHVLSIGNLSAVINVIE